MAFAAETTLARGGESDMTLEKDVLPDKSYLSLAGIYF
jgi:hypothetical protein